jgi:hypothetical protein
MLAGTVTGRLKNTKKMHQMNTFAVPSKRRSMVVESG